jgi:hypothetical protein
MDKARMQLLQSRCKLTLSRTLGQTVSVAAHALLSTAQAPTALPSPTILFGSVSPAPKAPPAPLVLTNLASAISLFCQIGVKARSVVA